MTRSSLAPALCLLAAALPAAFSAPAKQPGKTPPASKTFKEEVFRGITQVSFTRGYSQYDGGPEGWYGETVTFDLTPPGAQYTATRLVNVPPSEAGRVKQDDTGHEASDNGGLEMPAEPSERSQGRVSEPDCEHLTKLLTSVKFFESSRLYRGGRADGRGYQLDPTITIRAVRNGTPKTVTLDAAGPEGLWALQAALRGVASDVQWRKVEKTADAGGVKPH
jgi:hypothetical protein